LLRARSEVRGNEVNIVHNCRVYVAARKAGKIDSSMPLHASWEITGSEKKREWFAVGSWRVMQEAIKSRKKWNAEFFEEKLVFRGFLAVATITLC
jgi:hypothetical protein